MHETAKTREKSRRRGFAKTAEQALPVRPRFKNEKSQKSEREQKIKKTPLQTKLQEEAAYAFPIRIPESIPQRL